MERKKMIEEMKEWTSLSCITITKNGCNGRSCADCIATTILNDGYRKIHAGEIVLTRDEAKGYEEYKAILAEVESPRNAAFYRLGQKRRDEIRKETAREIYLDALMEFSPSARASGKTNFFVQLLLLLKKICNKHGAEIPESVEVE